MEEEREEENLDEDVIQVGHDPSASEADGTVAKEAAATTAVGSAGDNPGSSAPEEQQVLSEGEAPVPPTESDNLADSPALSPDEPSSSKAWEGGYRSNRPSDALVPDPSHGLPEAGRGRNRWKQVTPASTSSPPCGVEPAPTSPSSSTSHEEQTTPHKIAPWRRVRRTPQATVCHGVPSIPEQGCMQGWKP